MKCSNLILNPLYEDGLTTTKYSHQQQFGVSNFGDFVTLTTHHGL